MEPRLRAVQSYAFPVRKRPLSPNLHNRHVAGTMARRYASREIAMHRRTLRLLVAWSAVLAQMLIPAFAVAHDATPVPEAAGCTAGSSGIGDPYFPLLGNSGYDVQHYTLDLDLDVAGASISTRSTSGCWKG